jgi:hypothetical protein
VNRVPYRTVYAVHVVDTIYAMHGCIELHGVAILRWHIHHVRAMLLGMCTLYVYNTLHTMAVVIQLVFALILHTISSLLLLIYRVLVARTVTHGHSTSYAHNHMAEQLRSS